MKRSSTHMKRPSTVILAVSVALAIGGVTAGAVILRPSTRTPSAATNAAERGSAPPVTSGEPPRTSTPNAPGIVIATDNGADLPDPFLVQADGEYFMYLSSRFGDLVNNVPMLVGAPGHWSPVSDAMPRVPSWAVPVSGGGTVWDPTVTYLDGRYVMYSAPQLNQPGQPTHCLGVAISATPQGPFVPAPGPPLVCQTALGGDIDAQLFVDPEGPGGPAHPNYLVWKSDNNNLSDPTQTVIWAAPMANDGLSLAGAPVQIFSADEPWELPVLEAPQMVKAPDGTVWLFFSAGTGYYDARYAMGAAKCSGPLGGCHDVSAGPLIASNAQGSGPGEETVFVSPAGSTWLLYSPWHTNDVSAFLRPVEAARIGWDASGPYVAEAGTFPPPTPHS